MRIDFLNEANAIKNDLVDWRRDLHRNPELGFEEHRTARIVAHELDQLGLEVSTGLASTGVVGLLRGNRTGVTILIRVDMDALPIHEENEVDYRSTVPGVMHACGHDGHTAIGLGVARILAKYRASIAGTVKILFQPAEEGLGGAAAMIRDGVLGNPKPDIALGLHLINDFPLGKLVIHRGPLATAHDRFHCSIRGRGGHGAIPHLAQDPIVAAGHVITSLQTIVSRNVDPLETAVISIGTIKADGASNIIPEEVVLTGTMRSFLPGVQQILHRRLDELVKGICRALRCEGEVTIETVNPAIINDPDVASVVRQAAKRIVGEENIDTTYRSSASDDVAFYLERIPGCVFFIGSANHERGLTFPVHNARFDFDEDALVIGSATAAAILAEYLIQD